MILDGKKLADTITNNLKSKIFNLHKKPTLSIILIGNNEDSLVYVNMKQKKCNKLGIKADLCHFEKDISSEKIILFVQLLNYNTSVKGIMIQLPIYFSNYREILDTICPEKDVDGLTSYSLGKLMTIKDFDINNVNFFISSTIYGIFKLIDHYNITIKGKNITVIGNSSLVGMPLAVLLSKMGGTINICNIDTINLEEHTIDKDIVISCCGVKGIINGSMIKEDVIIIDVGISVVKVGDKKKIYGDCDWESVKEKANMITPVPGGVGPMTIASLLEQLCS